MLTIHWDDLPAAAFCGRGGQVSGHDERLLVRERYSLPRFEGGKCRVESRGADDRIQDNLGVRPGCRLHETLVACAPSRAALGAIPDDSYVRGTELRDLLLEQSGVRERRQRGDVKSVALSLEHAKRRRSD